MILGGIVLKSPAQGLKAKAQVSLSPKLSSRLRHKAQVRLSSVGHYFDPIALAELWIFHL